MKLTKITFFAWLIFFLIIVNINQKSLALEIIVDNSDINCIVDPPGSWSRSTWGGVYGEDKFYTTKGDGSKTVTWQVALLPGRYAVYAWVNDGSYTNDAQYRIFHSAGTATVIASQYMTGGGWSVYLGSYNFDTIGIVRLSNYWTSAQSYIVADAIKFVSLKTTTIFWHAKDTSSGLKAAVLAGKPLLIYFTNNKSKEAFRMEEDTFTNSTVISIAERFICVKINVDENPDAGISFGIYRVPTIIFLDNSGAQLGSFIGYLSPETLVKEMENILSSLSKKPPFNEKTVINKNRK